MTRPQRTSAFGVAMVVLHTVLVVRASFIHSPNANEVAHLASGISHWQLGEFELYRVNPPMVRLVAAVPAVLLGCKSDWSKNAKYSERPGSRPEFRVVPQFVELNGRWTYWYVIFGRLMCVPFSWLGAWACFRWADELYGRNSALLATALWCFSPNELALAAYMTPDGVASALGVAAGYAFWRWLDCPTWGRSTIAGILLGFTLLSKLTWVILLVLWPVIGLVDLYRHRRMERSTSKRLYVSQLALCLVLGLYILNLGYLFEGTMKPLGEFQFVSRTLTQRKLPAREIEYGNCFRASILGGILVPFPEQYVLGCDAQKADFEVPRRTYFRGRMHDHGLWYYYIYAFAVKTPLGIFLIGLVALLGAQWGQLFKRMDWIVPTHFLFLLGVVSAETSWNAHLRYALPAMPFALIWTSRAAQVFDRGQKFLSSILATGCIWFVASSLRYSSDSLSYFNELAGGPESGHLHLIDSNVDWGQDLFLLKNWLDRHPEVGRVGLAYYGHFNPRTIGIDFFIPEANPAKERTPGCYVISATMMHGKDEWLNGPDGKQCWCQQDGFTDFLARTPIERLGYSLFIFNIP